MPSATRPAGALAGGPRLPAPPAAWQYAEVVDFLKDRVATYKLPEALEVFDDFPCTPTGKIQRHVLTHQVVARRGPWRHGHECRKEG
jgi:acyl-coenzyme A synthetase/AMP-(fatty) acid ligase